jgi:hypothetical protein
MEEMDLKATQERKRLMDKCLEDIDLAKKEKMAEVDAEIRRSQRLQQQDIELLKDQLKAEIKL